MQIFCKINTELLESRRIGACEIVLQGECLVVTIADRAVATQMGRTEKAVRFPAWGTVWIPSAARGIALPSCRARLRH